MKFKKTKTYPTSQLDESSMIATMFLDRLIGDGMPDSDGDPTLDALSFASEMYNLKNFGFDIELVINSGGGEVVSGLSIFDAVVRTKADTRAVGLAASMAFAIHQAGRKRKMNDIATLMAHGIKGNGADQDYVNILDEQLRRVLESRTKLGRERIDNIFDNDIDTFFALVGVPENRHAVKMGLVDEVVQTGLNVDLPDLSKTENVRKLVPIYNKVLTPSNESKSRKMSDFLQVKAELGLDPEASEAAVLKAIQKLSNSAKGAQAFETANKTLKAENAALKEGRVDELLAEAKGVGYPEDQLDGLKTFAEANFDGAKNLVNGLKGSAVTSLGPGSEAGGKAPNVSLTTNKGKDPKEGQEGEDDLLTYNEYMKTPENEAKFYELTEDQQNKVFDAHAKAHNIKTA